MADGITDEVRRVGWDAYVAAIEGGYDSPQVYAQTLEAIIAAFVDGRAVVDLPEPDGEARHCPTWQGPEGYGVITATVWSGKIFNNEPMVDTPDHMHKADEAEQLGWMLIASAVRARKMAAEKSAGAAGGVL